MALTFQQAGQALDQVAFEATQFAVFELRVTAEQALIPVLAQWPVDTGFSLGRWAVVNTPVGATIINDAEYVQFVRDGLADRLILDAVVALDQDTEARLDDQLRPIFEGRR